MENNKKQAIRLTDIVLISGKRGTGKTFFGKNFITENLQGKIKVMIWDPLWQYQDLGVVVHDLSAISLMYLADKSKAIVFQPREAEDDEKHFDNVAYWVFKRQNIVLYIEEMNEYTTPSFIPPNFRALVRRGRNFGIGIMGVTHRPAWMSLNFLNMIDHWFIFQQDLERDLDRIAEYLQRTDWAADKDKDGIKDFIATMPDRHYIHFYRDRETGKAVAIPCKPIVPKQKITTTPIK